MTSLKSPLVIILLLVGCGGAQVTNPSVEDAGLMFRFASSILNNSLLPEAKPQTAVLFNCGELQIPAYPLMVNTLGYEVFLSRHRISPILLYCDVDAIPALVKHLESLVGRLKASLGKRDAHRLGIIETCSQISSTMSLIGCILSWDFCLDKTLSRFFKTVPVNERGKEGRRGKPVSKQEKDNLVEGKDELCFAEAFLKALHRRLKALVEPPDDNLRPIIRRCLGALQNCTFVFGVHSGWEDVPTFMKGNEEASKAFEQVLKSGLKAVPVLFEFLDSKHRFWAFLLMCDLLGFKTPLHAYLAQNVGPMSTKEAVSDIIVKIILSKEITRLRRLATITHKYLLPE